MGRLVRLSWNADGRVAQAGGEGGQVGVVLSGGLDGRADLFFGAGALEGLVPGSGQPGYGMIQPGQSGVGEQVTPGFADREVAAEQRSGCQEQAGAQGRLCR